MTQVITPTFIFDPTLRGYKESHSVTVLANAIYSLKHKMIVCTPLRKLTLSPHCCLRGLQLSCPKSTNKNHSLHCSRLLKLLSLMKIVHLNYHRFATNILRSQRTSRKKYRNYNEGWIGALHVTKPLPDLIIYVDTWIHTRITGKNTLAIFVGVHFFPEILLTDTFLAYTAGKLSLVTTAVPYSTVKTSSKGKQTPRT